jgi:CRISPR-associated protein (TIGR03985 family)
MTREKREVFNYPATIEVLKLLTPGSLKQNLAKAVRLWVILRSLYGGNGDDVKLQLADEFTFLEWRNLFFIDAKRHHVRDSIPSLHHPECRCSKQLIDWLFTSSLSIDKVQWCQTFRQYYDIEVVELENLLLTGILTGIVTNCQPDDGGGKPQISKRFSKALTEGRLFAVTSRNLKENDFQTLVNLGWLTYKQEKDKDIYTKIDEFPGIFLSRENISLESGQKLAQEQFTNEELSAFNNSLSQPINGVQRFFIHTEYIIHPRLYNHVESLQQQLKQIWEQEKIAFLKLNYRSAKLYQDTVDCIVYPVCIYYYQRAPYLFAYGQIPQPENENAWSQINWYDYRIDRILALQELSRTTDELEKYDIPKYLIDKCWGKYPPTPNDIKHKMSEAWGFDIYQPGELLILRFNQYFYANNIQGTERDEMFAKVSPTQVQTWIKFHRLVADKASPIAPTERQHLISKVKSDRNSIYCKIDYRQNDNNIVMRLRAWGPNVEVILPWSLRQRMRKEIEETYQFYI